MITKECNKGKYCCFYVSNFHLEMILLPYIKKHLDDYEFIVLTEENLKESLEILINRVNINKDEKEKILKLNWNNNSFKINESIKQKMLIINGSIKYINEIHKKIEKLKKISYIDCYNIDICKIDLKKILCNYDEILNTEN